MSNPLVGKIIYKKGGAIFTPTEICLVELIVSTYGVRWNSLRQTNRIHRDVTNKFIRQLFIEETYEYFTMSFSNEAPNLNNSRYIEYQDFISKF